MSTQTHTNLARASLVSRSVQIESVNLARIAMNSRVEARAGKSPIQLRQRFKTEYDLPQSDFRTILVRVNFMFEAFSQSEREPDQRVMDINARFLVAYRTINSRSFPPDALQHFAELNGTYNAWPYWRELVQSMTMRAGMSGVTVPVFRPKARRVEVQESLPIPDEAAAGPAMSPTA